MDRLDQLSWLDCSCVLLPGTLTLTIYTIIGITCLSVILRGGAGKNGSTVAVCLLTRSVFPSLTSASCCFRSTPSLSRKFHMTLSFFFVFAIFLDDVKWQGTSVLSPAIPLGLVIVPAYIIACKSEEQIFEQHPSLYIIAFGLVVAKVTNRLVVSFFKKRNPYPIFISNLTNMEYLFTGCPYDT